MVFIHDKVASELRSIITMRFIELSALQPTFDVHPHHTRVPGPQAGTFQLVGFVGNAITVEQDGECVADVIHPLLEGGECSERNDENTGIEFGEFILARTQLCGMLTAGYSAKMTEEDEQNMIAAS